MPYYHLGFKFCSCFQDVFCDCDEFCCLCKFLLCTFILKSLCWRCSILQRLAISCVCLVLPVPLYCVYIGCAFTHFVNTLTNASSSMSASVAKLFFFSTFFTLDTWHRQVLSPKLSLSLSLKNQTNKTQSGHLPY